jgi:hypothetical protein
MILMWILTKFRFSNQPWVFTLFFPQDYSASQPGSLLSKLEPPVKCQGAKFFLPRRTLGGSAQVTRVQSEAFPGYLALSSHKAFQFFPYFLFESLFVWGGL